MSVIVTKKNININGLKMPAGCSTHLLPLFLSRFVSLSQEKPDLANSQAVLFRPKGSSNHTSPVTWYLDALREQSAMVHLSPSSRSGRCTRSVLELRYHLSAVAASTVGDTGLKAD